MPHFRLNFDKKGKSKPSRVFRPSRRTQPTRASDNRGFALFTALWLGASLSILAVAILTSVLNAASSIGSNQQALVAEQLQNAALKAAVFDIMRPRQRAAVAGIPRHQFIYQTEIGQIEVTVQNEAAFLDASLVDQTLLTEILAKLNIDAIIVESLTKPRSVQTTQPIQQANSFANLTKQVRGRTDVLEQLLPYVSFYNGSKNINPLLADERLLAALPQLSQSDVAAIMSSRAASSPGLFSDAITHPMLSNRVSNHYRIHTVLKLGSTVFSKTRIIKLSLDNPDFFSLVAEL